MKHYVVVAGVAWGHLRPMQALCIRLCHLNPDLYITLTIPKFHSKRAALDRRRYGFDDVKDRFHLVEGGADREEGLFVGSEEYREMLGTVGAEAEEFYKGLMRGEPILDSLSGHQVKPWNTTPDAVLLDITVFQVGIVIRALHEGTGATVMPKLFSMLPIATSCVAFNYGPVFNYMVENVRACENREAGYQKYVVESEVINELPGLHPFYHRELDPNRATWPMYDIWHAFNAYKSSYDSMVTMWPTVFEREFDEICASYMRSKKHYTVGPQLPRDDPVSGALELDAPGQEGEVTKFLDEQHRIHGDHRVLYISFGSLEWPPLGDHLWHLLDVLDELQVPYLLSRGNAPPEVADKIPERIQASEGRGHFATWAPQVTVLSHPATMGFVTHGGSNSAMEALLCGVPMVQWPYAWDQPMIANQMDFIGAAIELLEVRGGDHNVGRKTARGPTVVGTPGAIKDEMRNVIRKLQGSSGEAMRARVRHWGGEIKKDMSEGGEAYAQMKELAFVKPTKL